MSIFTGSEDGSTDSQNEREFEGSEHFDSDEEVARLWRASATPEESFSDAEGANENGLWKVQIVGEEVDSFGEVRYEARWENWKRPDGSNVTWDNRLIHPDDIRGWRKTQTRARKLLAEESLDIEIWSTLDITNTQTRLRAQAYEEKLHRREQEPLELGKKMAALLAEKLGGVRGDSRRPASARSTMAAPHSPSSDGTSASRRGPGRRAASDRLRRSEGSTSTSSGTPSASRSSGASNHANRSTREGSLASQSTISTIRDPSVSPKITTPRISKGKARAFVPPSSPAPSVAESEPRVTKPLPARAARRLSVLPAKMTTKKDRLQRRWAAIAKNSRAAPITITNEVDDELGPHLPDDFEYLESGYIYADDVPQMEDEEAFLRCECDECTLATACSCQDVSEVEDEHGRRSFAYTEDGLFAFNVPPGVFVIECNSMCQCNPRTCPNRVAQRPRDVPLDIFKTGDRGWGVRSPVDIEQGKVLGDYSGILVRRDAELTDDEKSYCFDLDGQEDPTDKDNEKSFDNLYSVVSNAHGNWTRFINHSCTPNLRVYSVVYDTVPEMNMPHVCFVALQDISAYTELTVDYDPAAAVIEAARVKGKGKGKGKAKPPNGTMECLCGSSSCRGWIRA